METKAPIHIETQELKKTRFPKTKWLIPLLLLITLSCALTYVIVKKYVSQRELWLWANDLGYGVMSQDVNLRQAFIELPVRYLQSFRPVEKVPKLVIDIKFKNFQKLQKKRDEAVAKGFLIKESDDFVPASIRLNGQTIKVKLRLKGDLTDHLQGNKWSFRIYVKGKDHIFGLRKFSIQQPGTRSFQAQPLFFDILRKMDVLAPRYFFVDVTVNGKDIGLMALEEHFSKELLESQGRRESVIIKFDESLFWDEWIAIGRKGTVFNSYRNATIDAFGSSKIAKSEILTENYAIAVGLLRGFVSGGLSPSEVFDVKLMGRFLAISELWGASHSLFWNNMRFYYNPITAKLEPIGFDSYRKILKTDDFNLKSMEESIIEALFSDPEIHAVYINTLREMAKEIINSGFLDEIRKSEKRYLAILRKEFYLLDEFPYHKVIASAQNVLELFKNNRGVIQYIKDLKNSPKISYKYKYPTILQAYIIKDFEGSYLELFNAVPEDVEIQSIQWISSIDNKSIPFKPISAVVFPIKLSPTTPRALPISRRIYYKPLPDLTNYFLKISANIQNNKQLYDVKAQPYYAPLKQNPVPVSSAEKQLLRHPFLIADREKHRFYIKPGKWQVNGSLFIPKGYSLTVSAGTILQFKPKEGLIAHGNLYFQGTEKNPILLEGISSTWEGIVVLNAGYTSHWTYVIINNTAGINRPDWKLTGGVTFYQSDIEMKHCRFKNNKAEDALNIIRSKFRLEDIKVMNTVSDAFDSDFSEGTIEGGFFQDIGKVGGGDGVDISGSHVMVNGTRFSNISDKALSVGEQSKMTAANIIIEHAGTGAVSKDGSKLEISGSTINNVENAGLMAYIKKPEYGPARITARDLKFIGNFAHARAQKESSITINGVSIKNEDIDVDQLYKTIMKPELRK